MLKLILWCILFVLCWPLAVAAILLYPVIWLISLPFRLVGITVKSIFELLVAVITLPLRLLKRAAQG